MMLFLNFKSMKQATLQQRNSDKTKLGLKLVTPDNDVCVMITGVAVLDTSHHELCVLEYYLLTNGPAIQTG